MAQEQTYEMKRRRSQKRPPLREIGKAIGRSNVHVYRILTRKGQYSKETERRVYAYIREWRRKKAD